MFFFEILLCTFHQLVNVDIVEQLADNISVAAIKIYVETMNA